MLRAGYLKRYWRMQEALADITNNVFLLAPAFKDYIWGGERLKTEYGKRTDIKPLAESWECSTHPDGPSAAVTGAFAGQSLAEIIKAHPQFLGEHGKALAEEFAHKQGCKDADLALPILVKLIDAKRDLSVQVHPDDAYAAEHEGQPGKTEMWYVLDAEPGSSLVCGLKKNVSREELRGAAQDGSIEELLNKVQVRKGDVFFIEPGTIHAIGAGLVIAEIQQSSNVTYRLYDYGRLGADGKPRQLHLDKALDVADLNGVSAAGSAAHTEYGAFVQLASCRYFTVDRLDLSKLNGFAVMKFDYNSFHVLLCLDGTVRLAEPGRKNSAWELQLRKGDCVFVPADGDDFELDGNAVLLDIYC